VSQVSLAATTGIESPTEKARTFIRQIRRAARRKFTAEEKVRIILEGLRRETPIRDLCRREGIRPSTCYTWLKDFMEVGKRHLQPEKGSSYHLDSGLTRNGESRIV
jgi:transposase-like protein